MIQMNSTAKDIEEFNAILNLEDDSQFKTEGTVQVQRREKARLPRKTIKSVRISLAKKDQLMASEILINKASKASDQSYGASIDSYPSKGTLYDIRMGPIDRSTKCLTCGKYFDECLGHPGYIKLAHPIMKADKAEEIVKIMNLFSPSKDGDYYYPKFQREQLRKMEGHSISSRFKKLKDNIKEVKYRDVEMKSMLKSVEYKLKKKEVKGVDDKTKKNRAKVFTRNVITSKVGKSGTEKELSYNDIRDFLSKIRTSDLALIYDTDEKIVSRPENAILDVISVPPPRTRMPPGQLRQNSDITDKLADIVETNIKLEAARDIEEKEFLIAKIESKYTEIFEGAASANKKIVPLKELFNKKGGLIHGFVAKPADFGARTVISPDPNIPPTHIAIGTTIADKLSMKEKYYKFIAKVNKLSKRDIFFIIDKYFVNIFKEHKKERDELASYLKSSVRVKLDEVHKIIKNVNFDEVELKIAKIYPDFDEIEVDKNRLLSSLSSTMETDAIVKEINLAYGADLVINSDFLDDAIDFGSSNEIVINEEYLPEELRDPETVERIRSELTAKSTSEDIIKAVGRPLSPIAIMNLVTSDSRVEIDFDALDEIIVKDIDLFIANKITDIVMKNVKESNKSINSFISQFYPTPLRKRLVHKVISYRNQEINELENFNLDKFPIEKISLKENKGFYDVIIYYENEGIKTFTVSHGDIIIRRIKDDDIGILVRQPVLHTQNMQSVYIKIIPNILTISINPSIAKGYAADFDG